MTGMGVAKRVKKKEEVATIKEVLKMIKDLQERVEKLEKVRTLSPSLSSPRWPG